MSKDLADDGFDNALFDLLVQACSVHACKDCTKVQCEICICLGTLHPTLAALRFGTNLFRGAPLWVKLFCCLTIKKFKLETTTGSSNGRNFKRFFPSDKDDKPAYVEVEDGVLEKTLGRIRKLATIVDHVVASLSHVSSLKDVSPLLPLDFFFEKDQVIESIRSQFGGRFKQPVAKIRWVYCDNRNVCFIWKICTTEIDMANVYYINTTDHKWFEYNFKNSLLFLGALELPVKSAKKQKLECSAVSAFSPVQETYSDDVYDCFEFLSGEQTEFQALKSKELLGIRRAKHWAIIFCIRQLQKEQDCLWRSIEIQRQYVRLIETSVFQEMAVHSLYFEYLSTSPTPAPKFVCPASAQTLTAIAMSLTVKNPKPAVAMFPFPEGSVLATLSPHQEKNVVKSYSKLSIGLGRVRCNHCDMILVADSVSKHMMRKHPGILNIKETSAACVIADKMPKQFRRAFSKVRRQPPCHFCRHRHPHFSFQLRRDLAEYSSDVRLMCDM
jgi:hypothetical protein